jgi:integrase
MKLTDLLVKRLKAPDTGQKTHFDETLRGFGVRVSQGGTKSFIVMYGPSRKLRTLGRYPALSLADARKEAKRVQVEVLEHSDHLAQPERVNFAGARARFLADSKVRNKERTYTDYRRLLNRHFAYTKDISDVSRRDVMSVIEGLATTPSEQQHAFVAIRIMMNWCFKRGLIDSSPVPPLSFTTPARSHILSDDDLAAVWHRKDEIRYPYGNIIQLLLLTGQRRGEIAALRRSWIEDDLIVFPKGFTKNKREHRLPLSPMAQKVLSGLPDTGDLYFPARGVADRAFNGWGKSKQRFDKTLGEYPKLCV